jgi:hypothetical protein
LQFLPGDGRVSEELFDPLAPTVGGCTDEDTAGNDLDLLVATAEKSVEIVAIERVAEPP